MTYAELVCHSNYSFLRGASHPEELVARAAELGVSALAITDHDGFYGLVKAHLEARQRGLKLVIGSTLTLTDAPPLTLYATSVAGYSHLCSLISESRLTHPKGEAGLPWERVLDRAGGLMAVLPHAPASRAHAALAPLAEAFPNRFFVGVSRHLAADDERHVATAKAWARKLEVPLLAHNDVHTHTRARQPLQDVLTAIRCGTTVSKAGTLLFPNAERTLKSPAELSALFPDLPDALERTLQLAHACQFSLDDLRYQFSEEALPPGLSPMQFMVQLVEKGLHVRYPSGTPDDVRRQIDKEYALIEALDYPGYFLALWDIVRFARERGILCQGRGSAANSAVCFALQITSIDPVRMGLLFERFLSMERKEPPDIDVDFEHERREEVIQYVYEKHGRHRAAMVCEHICFRGRMALREVGKALGLSLDQVDRLAGTVDFGEGVEGTAGQLQQAGLSPDDLAVKQTLALARQLIGMPRHLSIHVGGFVITSTDLSTVVPIENGAMEQRTVVQWEKDDLAALNILKVDLLSLGMLTAISRCLRLIEETTGHAWTMATIPAEDPAVYDMLCDGDSIGTFQVESRAQQNMLPRLKPRCFYDLVVEIAIIRPGPIVGEMVHPYLRRRNGEEAVTYPSPEVRDILDRTLGVPLFQEQAMKLAMVAAGFTAGESDRLRRALTNKRADELLPPFRGRFVEGAVSRGYSREFASACFDSFKGFSHYGFPESHSASFALIAYASSWLKKYYPAAFCASLLDSQPMGFYAPHTLVDDARRHGVEAAAVDVNASNWECALEVEREDVEEEDDDDPLSLGERVRVREHTSPRANGFAPRQREDAPPTNGAVPRKNASAAPPTNGVPSAMNGDAPRTSGVPSAMTGAVLENAYASPPTNGAVPRDSAYAAFPTNGVLPRQPVLRLGFELVKGLREESARKLEAARIEGGPFTSVADLALRTRIPRHELTRLALAGALNSLCHNRRNALWDLHALGPFDADDLFFGMPMVDSPPNGVAPGGFARANFPPMSPAERVAADFETVSLSLESHPVGLLREQLTKIGAVRSSKLLQTPSGRIVRVGGLIIVRQRPPTAKGFTFLSMEDEDGIANVIVEPSLFERFRREITATPLLIATGRVERSGKVVNLKVTHLEALVPDLPVTPQVHHFR
ncbi:MAG: error-prone DNA polymerase [Archangium sp.]|nr:error-prone DNA polymerase [Archangium sp.]